MNWLLTVKFVRFDLSPLPFGWTCEVCPLACIALGGAFLFFVAAFATSRMPTITLWD